MDNHILFVHSSVDEYLGCFYILAIINNATINICIQIIVWTCVFISLEYISGVELLSQMSILCLTVWGTAKLFSKVAVPFYIPTSSVWGLHFLHILTHTFYYLTFELQAYLILLCFTDSAFLNIESLCQPWVVRWLAMKYF